MLYTVIYRHWTSTQFSYSAIFPDSQIFLQGLQRVEMFRCCNYWLILKIFTESQFGVYQLGNYTSAVCSS